MRGVSPALTSLLLIAIAVVLILYIYPWLSALSASLQYQWSQSATKAATAYPLYITIIPPPADASSSVAIIPNFAPFTIPNVRVHIIDREGTMISPSMKLVEVNGEVVEWNGGNLPPGGIVLVTFPPDENYFGYQVLVSSPDFLRNVYIMVGT